MNNETEIANANLDELINLFRSNGFNIIDAHVVPNCALNPIHFLIRFEGDENEGQRAVELANQNGYRDSLDELHRVYVCYEGELASNPYWHFLIYARVANAQGSNPQQLSIFKPLVSPHS